MINTDFEYQLENIIMVFTNCHTTLVIVFKHFVTCRKKKFNFPYQYFYF